MESVKAVTAYFSQDTKWQSPHTQYSSTACKKGLEFIHELKPCVLSAELMVPTLRGRRLCSGDL